MCVHADTLPSVRRVAVMSGWCVRDGAEESWEAGRSAGALLQCQGSVIRALYYQARCARAPNEHLVTLRVLNLLHISGAANNLNL